MDAGMTGVADAIGLAVIVLLNTATVALTTRFFRVRLHTRWGAAIYAVLFGMLALFVTTLVLAGFLGLGPDLDSRMAVLGVTIVGPLTLGVTIDYFWMPDPANVELPEPTDRS
ncbi:putative membrane protein [Halorhabdus sp. SVX81]|nr:putative membrane protein [Halorhabdus sp. SVX81]